MSQTIKCISLWQPWASLMAIGAKKIETRHWPIRYRGPLAIHAAKNESSMHLLRSAAFNSELWLHDMVKLDEQFNFISHSLPLGAIVAVVNLTGCERTEDLVQKISGQEESFGDYSAGRYGWVTQLRYALPEPIPFRGQQGLFDIDAKLVGL